MESELQMQLDNLPNRMSLVNDGIPPQSLSESLLRSSFPQLGAQNESMIGFPPILSSFSQGDPSKDHLHADKTVIYDGLLNRDNSNLHELCLGASSFPLPQEVPSESQREMFNCSYASSSSVPTSLNCDYDGIISDANGKWYQNRFLMQMENQDNANQWVLSNSAYNISSSLPYETSISHNELSLSLATCEPSLACSQGNRDLPLVGFGPSSSRAPHFSHEMISGSRYLTALQQILSELASFSLEGVDHTSYSSGFAGSSSNVMVPSNQFNGPRVSFKGANEFSGDDGSFEAPAESSNQRQEVEAKKSQLLGLLELVDDCYNRCLDEIHTVISAFHAATELDPQLHSCFTLRTVSFFYKNLRERISNEILVIGMDGRSRTESNNMGSFEKSFIQKQWALQQLKRKDQQLWRPQRGLPERSVSILRAWMFENFLHPYPKDSEKHLLALKSGLTRSQVSNWFINARVRIWKPLVEEMCSELNRRKGATRQNNEGTSDNNNRIRSHLSIYEHNQRFNT